MAEEKKPDSPELINLREREKVLIQKSADLEKLDGNAQLRAGIDIQEVKRRNQKNLTDVRAEIARLSK